MFAPLQVPLADAGAPGLGQTLTFSDAERSECSSGETAEEVEAAFIAAHE